MTSLCYDTFGRTPQLADSSTTNVWATKIHSDYADFCQESVGALVANTIDTTGLNVAGVLTTSPSPSGDVLSVDVGMQVASPGTNYTLTFNAASTNTAVRIAGQSVVFTNVSSVVTPQSITFPSASDLLTFLTETTGSKPLVGTAIDFTVSTIGTFGAGGLYTYSAGTNVTPGTSPPNGHTWGPASAHSASEFRMIITNNTAASATLSLKWSS